MKALFNVDGITCEHCVKTIKDSVGNIIGVFDVEVDLDKKQVTIEFDEKQAKTTELIEKIIEVGFQIRK